MKPPRQKVRLLRDHTHQNRMFRAGRILELPASTAAFLIRTERGESVDAPPVVRPFPPRGRRKRVARQLPPPTPTTDNES